MRSMDHIRTRRDKLLRPFALLLALIVGLGVFWPTTRAEQEIIVIDGAFDDADLYTEPAANVSEWTEPVVTPAAIAPQMALPEATPFVTLQKGSSGETVRQVQQRLIDLGFYWGKVSGDFMDGTYAGTRSFQRANNLAVNGKVNATTWNAMMAPTAVGKNGQQIGTSPSFVAVAPVVQSAPSAAQSVQQPVLQAPAAYAQPTAVPNPNFTFSRTLQYGDTGDDVRALQQRLTDLGYYRKEISGNFYDNTRAAVRAFQKNNGLPVDGVAGEGTQRVLYDDAQALNASATARPPAPPPYKLMIDITNQVTSAYALDQNGEYTLLVRRMICSTGTRANPTPLKTINGAKGRARWGYFPEWGSHAQYLTRIDSKNAFHSVLYSSPNSMSLVVGAYDALGTRASHGCVRLLVDDAKWIYDNCPSGTPITAFEGESDPELTQMLKPPPLDRSVMLPQVTPQPTAVPQWDPQAAPPEYRMLTKGSKGPDVWWLQTKLTTLGYYHGTISGGYYGGTIDAVQAFQRNAGLDADGVAGPVTLRELYENPAYASPIEATVIAPEGAVLTDPFAMPYSTPSPLLPPTAPVEQPALPEQPASVGDIWTPLPATQKPVRTTPPNDGWLVYPSAPTQMPAAAQQPLQTSAAQRTASANDGWLIYPDAVTQTPAPAQAPMQTPTGQRTISPVQTNSSRGGGVG